MGWLGQAFVTAGLVPAALCLSCVAYFVFYNVYVPSERMAVDIPLQHGASHTPSARVPIPTALQTVPDQLFSLAVDLELPCSDHNLNLGNFMVKADLQNDSQDVLASASRPTLVPRKIGCGGIRGRQVSVSLDLISSVRLKQPVTHAFISVGRDDSYTSRKYPELHTTKATLLFKAELKGLRWLMYHHRITAFCLVVPYFTVVQILTVFIIMAFFMFYNQRKYPQMIENDVKSESVSDTQSDSASAATNDIAPTDSLIPSSSLSGTTTPPGVRRRRLGVKQEAEASDDSISEIDTSELSSDPYEALDRSTAAM